jgi:hypothetical protein
MTPHVRPEPMSGVPGFVVMKYVIYFAVATPLVLGWLFWESAHTPPPLPMFHSFADTAHDQAVLARYAKNELLKAAARKPTPRAEHAASRKLTAPASTLRLQGLQQTARAISPADRNIRLR